MRLLNGDTTAGEGTAGGVTVTGADEELVATGSVIVDIDGEGKGGTFFTEFGRAGELSVIAGDGDGPEFLGVEREVVGWIAVREEMMASFFGLLLGEAERGLPP